MLRICKTRFSTSTSISSILRKLQKHIHLRACFSICHPRFDLLMVKFCRRLKNILRKVRAKFRSFGLHLIEFSFFSFLVQSIQNSQCGTSMTLKFQTQVQNFRDLQTKKCLLEVLQCFLELFLLPLDHLGFSSISLSTIALS